MLHNSSFFSCVKETSIKSSHIVVAIDIAESLAGPNWCRVSRYLTVRAGSGPTLTSALLILTKTSAPYELALPRVTTVTLHCPHGSDGHGQARLMGK